MAHLTVPQTGGFSFAERMRADAKTVEAFRREARQRNLRQDAEQPGIFFDLELVQILRKAYDEKLSDLQGRTWVPPSPEPVSPGAESFKYYSYRHIGKAKVVDAYAKDFPRVDLRAEEFTGKCVRVGNSYGYNLDELLAAQFAGKNLSAHRAVSARRCIEEKLDEMIFKGSVAHGIFGIANNPDVPVADVATVGPDTSWEDKADTDPNLILADIFSMFEEMMDTTNEIARPDTVLMPPAARRILRTTNRSGSTDRSLMDELQTKLPEITTWGAWDRLKNAGEDGDGRMIMYRRDPQNLWYEIPEEFNQWPPERDVLEWTVTCTAKSGGVVIPYPLEMIYRDAITPAP